MGNVAVRDVFASWIGAVVSESMRVLVEQQVEAKQSLQRSSTTEEQVMFALQFRRRHSIWERIPATPGSIAPPSMLSSPAERRGDSDQRDATPQSCGGDAMPRISTAVNVMTPQSDGSATPEPTPRRCLHFSPVAGHA